MLGLIEKKAILVSGKVDLTLATKVLKSAITSFCVLPLARSLSPS
jgi:hypothetical protein